MNNHQPDPRTVVSASAALVLVALGLAGLAVPQHASLVLAPASWNCNLQLILAQYFAAAQQVASLAVAGTMIVGGLMLIWRDQ
jgi:hypothetical protein